MVDEWKKLVNHIKDKDTPKSMKIDDWELDEINRMMSHRGYDSLTPATWNTLVDKLDGGSHSMLWDEIWHELIEVLNDGRHEIELKEPR